MSVLADDGMICARVFERATIEKIRKRTIHLAETP